MEIHVARSATQLGVFSAEEITAGLQDGRFFPTDNAWRAGMAAWVPLSQWAEFSSGIPAAPMDGGMAPVVRVAMPAWERGSSAGNFFGTIRDVALNPVATFDNMPAEGGPGRPLLFHYLAAIPGLALLFVIYAALLIFVAGEGILGGLRSNPATPAFLTDATAGTLVGILGGFLFCMFLMIPLLGFLGSAILHLFLLPFSPKGGYMVTFRATSYVSAAFLPLCCIPCINYIALPWQLVANVVALSRVHGIVWWKVALAALVLPCCACLGVDAALFTALLSAR